MGEVRPLPSPGDVFTDIRGDSRTMRVSYHAERDVLVVSLWAGGLCRGSFRMVPDDIDRLLALLRSVRAVPVDDPTVPEQPPRAVQPQAIVPDAATAPAEDQVDGTGDVMRSGPGSVLPGAAGPVPSAA